MALTLRTLKGSRLTHKELDDNFRHFTGSHTVDGTVTATAFVGDGSGLTNLPGASLTGTGILSGSIQIAELGAGIISGSAQLPAGIVSGSSQLDGEVFGFGADIVATGSFTGSFVGDGSGLTGISAGASAISGLSDVNLNALSDGEYLSYDAASTRWVNVAAPTADLTGTTVISGSNFEYDSSAQQWNVGKFVRFNGGLRATGFLAPIVLDTNSAVSTDPVLKVLGTNSTEELVVTNTEVQINDKLTLNSQFSNGGIIPTTDGLVTARVFHDTVRYVGHVSASLFSGSFYGDGSNLTGVTAAADLTGTTVISGSNLAYDSNTSLWSFDSNVKVTLGSGQALGVIPTGGTKYLAMIDETGKGFFSSFAIIDTTTTPTSTKATINGFGQAQFNALTIDNNSAFNGDIISLGDVNHAIQSGEVFKVTAGNSTSQIFRVNGDKEAVLNATLTVSDFDQSTPAFADFTGATQGVSGSFSGSFEGDGSGLTGLSAGTLPVLGSAPTGTPAVGTMVLAPNSTYGSPDLSVWVYTGNVVSNGGSTADWIELAIIGF